MTIHVNIGEAKTRLSELVAAALRGEEVILQKAGVPKLKLVPIEEAEDAIKQEMAERRKAFFRENAAKFAHQNISADTVVEPSMTDAEYEERLERKFGKPSD